MQNSSTDYPQQAAQAFPHCKHICHLLAALQAAALVCQALAELLHAALHLALFIASLLQQLLRVKQLAFHLIQLQQKGDRAQQKL